MTDRTRQWPLLTATVFFLLIGCVPPARAEVDPRFGQVVVDLRKSGLDSAFVERIFNRDCVRLDYGVLSLRLTIRESKINYGQFLTPESQEKCRAFIAKYRETLDRAEAEFFVPPGIVTGLLLLETRLGTYTGKFQTLSTLATHAAAGQREVADEVFRRLPDEEKKRWTPDTAARKLADRTSWSLGELKAFVKYLQAGQADPCQTFGSYTGAIGFCQFQPSNIGPYGRDGNTDGRIDLFQMEDAVYSAANYLNRHGWKAQMTEARMLEVLKTYNNSTQYAQTIIDIRRQLLP